MNEKELQTGRAEQSSLASLLVPLIIPAIIISEIGYRTVQVYEFTRDVFKYRPRRNSPTGNRTQASST